MKRDIRNRLLFILIACILMTCILMALILASGLARLTSGPAPKEGPLVAYRVIDRDPMLAEQWTRSDVFVDNYANRGGSHMVAAQGVVIMRGKLIPTAEFPLFALAATDGSLRWHLDDFASSLFATASVLYVGDYREIRAYDPRTGGLLWISDQLPVRARNVSYLLVDDNLIYAESQMAHLLRANTGEVVLNIDKDGYGGIKEVLRQTNTQVPAEFFDHFTDATLTRDTQFIRGVAEFRGGVRAIDRPTGKILWERPTGVLSNVAATESVLYFLTFDRQLLGLDTRTGEVVTAVQFEASPLPNSEADRGLTGGYYVAVDAEAGMVYAYFGDSAQLFAFKIVDDAEP